MTRFFVVPSLVITSLAIGVQLEDPVEACKKVVYHPTIPDWTISCQELCDYYGHGGWTQCGFQSPQPHSNDLIACVLSKHPAQCFGGEQPVISTEQPVATANQPLNALSTTATTTTKEGCRMGRCQPILRPTSTTVGMMTESTEEITVTNPVTIETRTEKAGFESILEAQRALNVAIKEVLEAEKLLDEAIQDVVKEYK